MLLSDKIVQRWEGDPFVVRVSTDPFRPEPLKANEALVLKSSSAQCPAGFRAYFALTDAAIQTPAAQVPIISIPGSLSYIADGDIVTVRPRTGDIRVCIVKPPRIIHF